MDGCTVVGFQEEGARVSGTLVGREEGLPVGAVLSGLTDGNRLVGLAEGWKELLLVGEREVGPTE